MVFADGSVVLALVAERGRQGTTPTLSFRIGSPSRVSRKCRECKPVLLRKQHLQEAQEDPSFSRLCQMAFCDAAFSRLSSLAPTCSSRRTSCLFGLESAFRTLRTSFAGPESALFLIVGFAGYRTTRDIAGDEYR
ncbi:hypothetical protein BDW22DRAFT_207518 [Trametopsis cervina]|nr:hypothetical protein BDW22DRAFT_207518 [Trametopsis cervina]